MVSFLSSFSAGGGSAAFSARVTGHGEDVKNTIAIHVAAVFQNTTTWGAMATLRTWKYSVREIPGAATSATGILIQVLGGPGFGSLAIDSYQSWTALLSEMALERVSPRTGLVFGHLTFILQP